MWYNSIIKSKGDTTMKAIKGIVTAACVLFIAWLALSWLDVVMTNNNPDAMCSAWNFFKIFF